MKALFLVPPTGYNARNSPLCRVYGCNYGFDYKPPIHLLAVATYARDVLGWDVQLLDCPAEGLDVPAFEAWVRDHCFDVVAHWTTYLSAVEDLRAAQFVRDRMPSSPHHLFMGAASTWRPEEFGLSSKSWCLLGEPEHTLRDLDAAWRGEGSVDAIDGLGWFDTQGEFHRGGFRALLDVTTLPMPDRTLLRGTYRANRLDRGNATVMVTSRGCGFRCVFCATNAMDQAIELEFKRGQPTYVERPPLRKRTVEQVVEEFELIASQGYQSVEVADNIFTWGRTRTQRICRAIQPLGMDWICLARANMLHDDTTVKAMADAGCRLVYMGSESFDDGLLDDMVKEIKVADVRKAVDTCRRNGLEPEVSVLMGGSPNETWRTLWTSFRAARSLGTPFVHFSAALPVPSSELYDLALDNGWFVDGDFYPTDNARDVIVDLPNLSARQLRMALKAAYAAQYLSPRSVLHHAKRVHSASDLAHKMRAAGKLITYLAEVRDRSRDGNIPPGRVTPPELLSPQFGP